MDQIYFNSPQMLVQNHFPFLVHPFLTAEKYGFPPVKNAVIAPPVLGGERTLAKAIFGSIYFSLK